MKNTSLRIASCALFLFPVVVAAQAPQNFKEVVALVLEYVRLLITLLFGLTFLVLIWGVVQAWVFGAGNTERIEAGQKIALWGVVGLFVMASLWGIVALVRSSLFGSI